MRERACTKYYCDWCSKGGLQKRAMATHEKHCTLNPNRHCRMCEHVSGGGKPDMDELKRLLPDPREYDELTRYGRNAFDAALEVAMPLLRERTENCPACIMAALRQKQIAVPLVEGFDFKKECEAVWKMVNEERSQSHGGW